MTETSFQCVSGSHLSLWLAQSITSYSTNKTGRYAVTGRWQAGADYLTLGSEPSIQMFLASYTSSFSTGSAFIFLPDRMVKDFMFMPLSVACEERPNIVFNLAGRNFSLMPYDYSHV